MTVVVDRLQLKAYMVDNRSVYRAHGQIKEAEEEKAYYEGRFFDTTPPSSRKIILGSTIKRKMLPGRPSYPGSENSSSSEDVKPNRRAQKDKKLIGRDQKTKRNRKAVRDDI